MAEDVIWESLLDGQYKVMVTRTGPYRGEWSISHVRSPSLASSIKMARSLFRCGALPSVCCRIFSTMPAGKNFGTAESE